MNKVVFSLLCMFFGTFSSILAWPTPPDPANIELLIALHKTNAKAENEALNQINLSLALTNQIKKKTIDIHDVRSFLDTRTSSAYSAILLAARLGYISKGLIELGKTFSSFTSATTSSMFKKPQALWYYTDAVLACKREITQMNLEILPFIGSGLDLLQATMDEKLHLLNTIQVTIDKCRSILDSAYLWGSYVMNSGTIRIFLEDVFESKTTDDIAKQVLKHFT